MWYGLFENLSASEVAAFLDGLEKTLQKAVLDEFLEWPHTGSHWKELRRHHARSARRWKQSGIGVQPTLPRLLKRILSRISAFHRLRTSCIVDFIAVPTGRGNLAVSFWTGSSNHGGNVGKIIAYDRQLTAAEVDAVEEDLASRYGIGDHPR